MLKPPIITSNDNNNTKVAENLNDLNNKGKMSGQQIESFSPWHAQTSSSAVTGTSELFGSTYAMLSDHSVYPEQWSGKQLSQSVLFEQPQIQPLVGNSYDPPVRFDPPYAYRATATGYMPTVPGLSTNSSPYYPRTSGYAAGQQFYAPSLSGVPNTQQLILAAQVAQASNVQQQLQQQVLRPEPLRPATQKSTNGVHRSTSNSSAETLRNNSVSAATVSPSDDNSLNSPALTSSGSAGSGTPPLGIDLNNTDLESGDEERVMCMACRGVYPSRRSLTGHIGRNEKCREIIGRNYLDALAQGVNPPIPGTDAAIKSGAITTGADGMSPVCPFCDRFISHYKGNIRRHINQCRKSAEPMKRHRVEAHEKQSPKKKVKKEQNEMYQHEYNDHDSSSMSGGMMNSPKISPPSSSFYGANSSDLCSPGEYSNSAYEPYPTPMLENTERTSTETAVLQDAYICEDCDFVTVYKGNMKRHLNTCHPQPEFKKWDQKLEGMRASNLGISGDRLQERLAAHKANSSRGRKPRKKKENNTEESESIDFKNILNSETGALLESLASSSSSMGGYSNGNNFQPPPPPPPMLL
ncbi:Zinc finger protein somi-1 [Caenorhabditis elegans]|uniref:Isoform a of Zinc finger protein somi-1 n=2 Tax=Caenorhabditis elegans TaxID=6239 RepID=A0A486WWJ9-2|nr:Zinc finger protein somi-1 [Caenorhabditis elegans]CAB03211.3 Zinc finger protein somi-1 [Caenorhabditis elegans]|eukprot:NP_506320.3 Suppressor of Overexpressed MIcro-RNA [Caenorhabditis elegans]